MKSRESKNIFDNYRPSERLEYDKYMILESIVDDGYDYSQNIVLKEVTRNIWGNIIAALLLITLGTLPFLFGINHEDELSEIAFLILMPLMGIFGLVFLIPNVSKLLNSSNRSYVIISYGGIKYFNGESGRMVVLKWKDIRKGVLKLYPSKFSPETYLLILTKQDKLVGIYLNELVDPNSRLFSKAEIDGLFGNINPRHDDIRKFLGKYTCA